MFKNSKILKGLSLAFALVLVLGCAVLLSNYVDASANTVIFYVSDHGDNTSGSDEATAFTSISSAIQKANAMKLPTGSRLKLIIVDRITTTTYSPDNTVALDANGHRLPITITSQNTTSADDYSDIYLAYLSASASSSYTQAAFYNDIYFKDIDITIKVHDIRVGMNPTGTFFAQRYVCFSGYDVTLDNVRIANERTGTDVGQAYVVFDYYTTNTTLNYDKVVTVKNYTDSARSSSVAWYLHNYRVPLVGLTVNIENSKLGNIAALAMSSTATTNDLRKFTLNLKEGAELTGFYVARSGHYGLSEGATFNYMEGSTVGTVYSTNSSAASGAGLHADVTHNVMGGKITSKLIASSNGHTQGNITLNMTSGEIAKYYGTGGSSSGSNIAQVDGTITNNVTGGKIGYFYGGGGETKTAESTTVINNITGGSISYYYGAGANANAGTVVNNVTGMDFGNNFYGGAGTANSTAAQIKNTLTDTTVAGSFVAGHADGTVSGSIHNEISNCTFNGNFIGGNRSGDVGENVTTKLSGVQVDGAFVAGNFDSGSVHSNITTLLTGGTFNGDVYGSNQSEDATVGCASLTLKPQDGDIALYAALPAAENLTTTFGAGDYNYQIGEDTEVKADAMEDEGLVLIQTQNWKDGHVYFEFSDEHPIQLVHPTSKDQSVAGSATFDGKKLIGSAGPFADSGAPGLETMVNFHLDETLGVTFWVSKSDIEDFIDENGKWTYSVTFAGKKFAEGEIADKNAFPADSIKTAGSVEYFTFYAGLGIPASQYDEQLLVVLGGDNVKTYTVYDLLESGISYAHETGDAELEYLLKAVHNYGTEANNRFDGTQDAVQYPEVVYVGSDTTTPSVQKYLRGVVFVSNSLSLDEKIAMNYYLRASEEFTVRAFNHESGIELPASKIVVQKVEGSEEYNYMVTLILDVAEMTEVYDLHLYIGSELAAAATNSVAYSCNAYIENGNSVEVAQAVLAYLEAAKLYQ